MKADSSVPAEDMPALKNVKSHLQKHRVAEKKKRKADEMEPGVSCLCDEEDDEEDEMLAAFGAECMDESVREELQQESWMRANFAAKGI